jgi:DNA repair ATPase RecN
MVELERLLVRALTDRDFLEKLKSAGFDPGVEYKLNEAEREILRNLRELQKGAALDTVVHASAEAMAQMLPKVKGGAIATGVTAECARVVPKLERVSSKLERVAPKLERVAPKLERVEPKLERVTAKLERVASKLERAGSV